MCTNSLAFNGTGNNHEAGESHCVGSCANESNQPLSCVRGESVSIQEASVRFEDKRERADEESGRDTDERPSEAGKVSVALMFVLSGVVDSVAAGHIARSSA
jgi:hypothetical protein